MPLNLTPIEARIMGVLIEKHLSTPDYYPMTLNALVNACNQKTNRNPVMSLDGPAVQDAVDALRQRRLAWQVMTQGSRAPKYEYHLDDVAAFNDRQIAILCELLLRGEQTPGELRAHTARLTDFPAVAAVERALQTLIDHEKGPFTARLERRPGHKESRYRHLLGPPATLQVEEPEAADQQAGGRKSGCDRLTQLESRVEELQTQLTGLAIAFEAFKQQFE
jgi:uncharacterized protein YceH (UPF0502 family)